MGWAKAIPAALSVAGGIAGAVSQGGQGGSGMQTQTATTKLPGWVENASMQNYGDATKISYEMPGPYTGPRTADLTPVQQEIIQRLHANVDNTAPDFQQAS